MFVTKSDKAHILMCFIRIKSKKIINIFYIVFCDTLIGVVLNFLRNSM